MNKNFAANLIKLALRDNYKKIFTTAFRDYHVKGFNSILLTFNSLLTLRLYVIEPGTSNLQNSIDPFDDTLLIHNHAFNFQCETIVGWMKNLTYREVSQGAANLWNRYLYTSAITSGSMTTVPDGEQHLDLVNVHHVAEGEAYTLERDELHRILVPSNIPVVLLVWQHAKKENHPALLYSKSALPLHPDTTGLYNRFTSVEFKRVMDNVLNWLQ